MFRKRRAVPPGFRIPVPFNPFTGKYAQFGPDLKGMCTFALTTELTTSDETAEAEILAQFGPGSPHDPSKTITVVNLWDPDESAYTFEGTVGKYGLAFWDTERTWIIAQMNCPT
jgi:hypothetical protein